LAVVVVQLRITLTINLPVTVVPVVVVLVVQVRMGVLVVKEARVRRVRATMVPVRVIIGTPQAVVVPVAWVTVETVKVVGMSKHTAVMV
tara:strand:+ start:536 stop:802 length:267 start_codon:yes stop_codon:yes gene_type:complete